MKLSHKELTRYSRQIMLQNIGECGQQKLKNAAVLCVGAGGIGSPALLYLAAAGIGKIGVIDHDEVDLSNLQRQILFSENEIGQQKSIFAQEKLNLFNADIFIRAYPEKLTLENAEAIFSNYDVIIDASDNFHCKYLTNNVSKQLQIPLVLASVYQFSGQLSVFNYQDGPCYRCLYPSPANFIPNCADAGVLGVVPGVMGTMAANEVLKILLGIGNVLSGVLLTYDSLSVVIKKTKLEKYAQCNSLHCGRVEVGSCDLEISSRDLMVMIQGSVAISIIDVREPWEFELYAIPGSKNIPLQEIPNFMPEKNVLTVLCCKAGYRSLEAVKILMKRGYVSILSLSGGVIQWALDSETQHFV